MHTALSSWSVVSTYFTDLTDAEPVQLGEYTDETLPVQVRVVYTCRWVDPTPGVDPSDFVLGWDEPVVIIHGSNVLWTEPVPAALDENGEELTPAEESRPYAGSLARTIAGNDTGSSEWREQVQAIVDRYRPLSSS